MLLEILLGVFGVLVLVFLLKKDPEPLLGIYSQPGKWFYLKKALFFVFLTLRKYRMGRTKKTGEASSEGGEGEAGGGGGYGMKSRATVDDMECVQRLSDDPLAIDCTYFNGLNANGDYILLRIARRHNREAELWLYINIEGLGFFQSPIHPDTTLYNTDGNSYSAGGLKFELLEPMRRWKVTFNGMLRKGLSETWPQENEEMVHVKFSFLWNAFTDPFDFDTDIYPGCLASAIAREKWSKEYFDRLKKSHQTHYEQWGELFGLVQVEGHEDKQLTLRGYRDHSYGVRDWHTFHRYAINFAYLEDGSTFHVDSLSMPGILSLLQCGYMSRPNCIMHPVSSTDMDMVALGENQDPPKYYEFNFTADGKSYHVKVTARHVIRMYLHDDWRSMIFEHVSDYEVNGVKGYGVFEFLYRNPSRSPVHPEQTLPLLAEPEIPLTSSGSRALFLPFTARECASSRLVGGKGCQLALLTQLKSTRFSVPSGFCLTISAFDLQVARTGAVSEAVGRLEQTACTEEQTGGLKSDCEHAMDAFLKAPIDPEVQEAVVKALVDVFGPNYDKLLFAVRSSAAGEDGCEMSAAGQMETVLGVLGLEKIYDAIRFCWASLFSHTAVAYRRQNGQLVKSSAGVVIQQMVPAAVAGVLFTRHPVTGNPGEIMLNANYGLGQSVVSGEVEPDQVTMTRTWKDEVTIKNKQIGNKKRLVTLTDSGIETIDAESKDECCLSDELILELASIGIELEKRFSDPRDIEFAVDNKDQIHLLQARPITTLDFDTEWHYLHEFDSALAMDREVVTTANIQEMMPGAMTPLSISSFSIPIDRALQNMVIAIGIHPCKHYPTKFVVNHCNQGFINLNHTFGIYEGADAIAQKQMAELSLLGEIVNEPTMAEVVAYNGELPRWKRIVNGLRHIWIMYASSKGTKSFDEKLLSFSIVDRPFTSAKELYQAITDELPLLEQMWTHHLLSSASSAVWSNVIMAIISQNGKDWKREHFSDLAMLLSKCEDVYSADVPSLLLKLAEHVQTKEERDKMLNSSPEEALNWLRSESSGPIGREFTDFLNRHGHRCIREAEFREKSWQMEPTKVVKVIQSMVETSPAKASTKSSNNHDKPAISKIKSKTTMFSRFILKFVWPRARRGVGARELSKSVSVKLADAFKQAYWKLAEVMVKESRLPDKDLFFFFTHNEIGKLLETRSARLITRAQKRRQVHGKQSSLRFPRINRGHPVPINISSSDVKPVASFKVSGLPVSLGVIKGRARIVTSLAEASAIQNGDILIVEYTDVGWSPYFPMITGLVTEIGGLLSHGAVVAREYGLPCVVNVANATRLFQSGDTVILNGTLGTVEKITE